MAEISADESSLGLFDLLIVGGGINGVGIARDAAGRGLKVLVVEQADLASATSSASTKLIHGGLRYLEYYEFRLVREALQEREVLLANAAHIIRPLRFVLPHDKTLRPKWMIRLGLFLYDHLGGRKLLPPSRQIDLQSQGGLRSDFRTGFEYSDCWVDDARLVALNAVDARERGAQIVTRTLCAEASRDGDHWIATLQPGDGDAAQKVRARALVNATGPWAAHFIDERLRLSRKGQLRLVKGSHIIIPRLYEGEHAYILQNVDRRIVFTIPYEQKFTLVGTTDIPFVGDPAGVKISPEEVEYLCAVVNRHFEKPVTQADIVWTYAGVRPLFDDDSGASASAVTRDYVFDLADDDGKAPLLNIYGGKITTYRRLAEQALEKLAGYFPALKPKWTERACLPGGEIPGADFEAFLSAMQRRYPWLPPTMTRRLARAYGSRVDKIIAEAKSLSDLGACFGGDLYEREVAYLAEQEWARSADDVLWRRSKLGLHLPGEAVARIDAWFAKSSHGKTANLRGTG